MWAAFITWCRVYITNQFINHVDWFSTILIDHYCNYRPDVPHFNCPQMDLPMMGTLFASLK